MLQQAHFDVKGENWRFTVRDFTIVRLSYTDDWFRWRRSHHKMSRRTLERIVLQVGGVLCLTRPKFVHTVSSQWRSTYTNNVRKLRETRARASTLVA